jgi:hypothetical protein
MLAMHISTKTFWAQKRGSDPKEYEDAAWVRKPLIDAQGTHFRFAVADGATESSYAEIWAKQLVRAFCKGLLDHHTIWDNLANLQQRWSQIVSERVMAQGRPLPWYAEEKIRDGAFAAILGLTIDEDVPSGGCGRWRAIALGDSCVAHIRGEQVLTCFPLDNSISFSNRPRLLPSNSLHNKSVIEHLYTVEETWKRGDIFYLMTDALACWFIKEIEVGQRPWRFLRELDLPNQDSLFQNWVEGLRASKAMRNDDVTLMLVNLQS